MNYVKNMTIQTTQEKMNNQVGLLLSLRLRNLHSQMTIKKMMKTMKTRKIKIKITRDTSNYRKTKMFIFILLISSLQNFNLQWRKLCLLKILYRKK